MAAPFRYIPAIETNEGNPMQLWKNLLDGMATMGNVLNSPPSYPDIRGGFARDAHALRRDASTVTRHLNRRLLQEYGKQEYPNQG